MPRRRKYVKLVPCPSERECGNQVRWKGANNTPLMCRECYLEEMRSADGRLRQEALAHAKKARIAHIESAAERRAARVPLEPMPDDPMLANQKCLWFERERVVAFIYEEVGSSVAVQLTNHRGMASRWSGWKSRPWLRFDQVDELLCVLGLWVGDLGEPHYSGSEFRYPALVPA